ncbi:MAG: hypothetical protein EHM20_06415 [Alphaproteobacteria bacterium]|nr:MAG: hypothetical protein EHM20_06415 [Alphaproteobacteria bacterium]
MVTKFFFLIIIIAITNLSYAQSFVMSLHTDHDYTKLHGRSSFHLFSDGKYVLETNTGLLGVCTSSEVGKFVGEIDLKNVEQIKKYLNDTEALCSGIANSSCTLDVKSKAKDVSWWMSDLTGKTKKTYYFKNDEKTPAPIRNIITIISLMQKKRTIGLTLTKSRENVFKLNYQGRDPLKLSLSAKNFMVVNEGGLIQSLTEVVEGFHFKDNSVTLKPGEAKEIKLDLNIFKGRKDLRLIFDSSSGDNPVGHSDIQFSPCLEL